MRWVEYGDGDRALRCPKTASQAPPAHYNAPMLLDPIACYQALKARDARFDGRFFVGVSSTRIYCRPVCTVKTPQQKNCTFYPSAAAAEVAGYRPVFALPTRARARQRQRRRDGAPGARGRRIDRRRLAQRGERRTTGSAPGRDRSSSAPRVPERAGRVAGRVRADASSAARQTSAHRHAADGHGCRDGERLRQSAALQCTVPQPLPVEPFGFAQTRGRHGLPRRAHFPSRLSTAARLESLARVSLQALDRRRGADRGHALSAHGAHRSRRQAACGMDRGSPVQAQADRGSADVGIAGRGDPSGAGSCEEAVRSRLQSRGDQRRAG